MSILLPVIGIISAAVLVLVYFLLSALLKAVAHINRVNSQLLLVIAGKEQKPETLRALVASERRPTKDLSGVAAGIKEDKKKKETETNNKDYSMSVGG
jgi:hypothetical protein